MSDLPPMLVIDDEEEEDNSFLGQGNLPNGTPTGNPGPCKCGYKHWCDGQEFDYVVQVPQAGKALVLGFNQGGMVDV